MHGRLPARSPTFDTDTEPWACKKFGPRPPGKVALVPDVTDFNKLPKWVAQNCAKPQEDCSKSMCCAEEGMQCFKKKDGWATCKEYCIPGPDSTDNNEEWSCNELGPRTPVKCPSTNYCRPQPKGLSVLTGKDLVEGEWGKTIRLFNKIAVGDNWQVQSLIKSYATPNENCTKNAPNYYSDFEFELCRTYRMEFRKAPDFFHTFLKSVYNEVVARAYHPELKMEKPWCRSNSRKAGTGKRSSVC